MDRRRCYLRILIFSIIGLNVNAFFTYPPSLSFGQQYPAPPVPRGYQPPPDPPLASEYNLNGATVPQNNQPLWQQRVPVPTWPIQKPTQEPVLINTVIQVYTNDKAPNEVFTELHTLSSVNGNERVEISRNTTLDTNYGTLVQNPPTRNNGKIAHVRAYAASNNTRLTKEELGRELDRELEKAIPFILDKLDQSDAAHKTTESGQHTTTATATTRHSDKDVTNEDLERLINEALSKISDDKARENAKKLTESIPQTTIATKVKETNEPYTQITSSNEETTSKIIIFEKTTTASSITEESAVPEAESDNPNNDVKWITATPPSGPKIVTQIVDLEPIQQSTPESVAHQHDNTEITVENTPITVFNRESTTILPSTVAEEALETEETTQEVTQPQTIPETTQAVTQPQTIPETTQEVTQPQTSAIPEVTQPQTSAIPETTQEVTQPQTIQETTQEVTQPQTSAIPETTQEVTQPQTLTIQEVTQPQTLTSQEETSPITEQQSQDQSTSTPILILTQEQTSIATTKSGVTGELLVPHHAVNAESSETHPRTWKPRRGNRTSTASPTTTPSSNDNTNEITTVSPPAFITEEQATSSSLTTSEVQNTPTAEIDVTTSTSESTPQTVNESQDECPVPNDLNNKLRGDVLFLLDGSNSVGEEKFENAKKLIHDTVKQFNNIGPDGVQFSLIQFNGEPFLEFSFRAHNCITSLLEDISDTSYINGESNIEKAIEKAVRFAYTKTRGDREDAPNVIVLITDGQSDQNVQIPVELIRKNGTTLLVIATVKVNPNDVASLAQNAELDVFNLTDANTRPLSIRLANRIEEVLSGKSKLSPIETTNPAIAESEDGTEVTESISEGTTLGDIQTTQSTESISEGTTLGDIQTTQSTLEQESVSEVVPAQELPASYQDENVQIQCLNDGVRAIFQVPESFAGTLSAKDHANVSGCFENIPLVNRDSNVVREIGLVIRSNNCGLNIIPSESPRGTNNSIVINLFHNKSLVTGQDKSYVVQCFVPHPELEQTLQTRLEIEGMTALSKTIFLNAVPPACEYTLRKDTPNGPILQTASIGQIVYHHWECKGSDEINSAYGLHIHNCFASNGTTHSYQIIDEKGCSSDPSLLSEVTYANDKILAHVRSFIFSFVDVQSLLFTCKLSLCLRDKDGCEGISPPVCKQSNFSELLLTRRARHYNAAFDAALTVDVETQRVGVTDPLRAEKRIYLPTDMKVGILIMALLIGACMGMCCFFWQRRPVKEPPKRMISAIFNDELPIVVEEQSRNGPFTTDSLARKSSMSKEGYLQM